MLCIRINPTQQYPVIKISKIIVTAALPYVYSMPHLGNITGSVLPADVYYRYLKMAGENAIYICGSDQHGTPIELAAIKRGVEPEALANDMHEKIKTAFENFEFEFTYYGKTHTEQNKEITYAVFDGLVKNGLIMEVDGEHPYCEIDNRFIPDRFIEGTCPHCKAKAARGDQCDNCGRLIAPREIIDPYCRICGKSQIIFKKTKNLAIDYPKLTPRISKFVKEASKNNWSRNSINKTISYIGEGLKPVEITRNLKWGFPTPMKGYEDTRFYVWFDAPIGYIGITKEWDSQKWKDYWMDKSTKLVQFMGKDNIQFHTIHWPGMLLGSDLGFVLPATIRASEFLNTAGGLKFSKSQGRGLDIVQVLRVLPADYWRFALVYIYPETSDSEFSIPAFTEITNNILNDKIGNLIHRVLTITKNNFPLVKLGNLEVNSDQREAYEAIVQKYRSHFEKAEIREALRAVVELADYANSFMNAKEPWKLAKAAGSDASAAKTFSDTVGSLLRLSYVASIMLYPFVPKSSAKALSYFGLDREPLLTDMAAKINTKLDTAITPVFSKIAEKELAALNEFVK